MRYITLSKHFSVVMPALEAELGISKVQLGIFLTLNGIIDGISRFVNGFLAEQVQPQEAHVPRPLVLSAVTNLVICFSPSMNSFMNVLDTEGKATMTLVNIIGTLWVLNGYFQGMGVPPCISLMCHWIRPSELATKQSIWNASHSIGAGLISVIWRIPPEALRLQRMAALLRCSRRHRPRGRRRVVLHIEGYAIVRRLPEIEDMDKDEKSEDKTSDASLADNMSGKSFKSFVNRMVFANPLIWILAVSNFCIYVVRFTILDWGATFLTQYKGMEISTAGTVVAASELVGGIAGMLLAGWFTDKFMKSRAHRTCFICTVGATLSFFLFWKSPAGMPWLSAIFICLSSFFIYGPQALLGTSASQQATKHACATANGILGIFGYASTAISGVTFGYLAEHFGWDSVFLVSVIIGLVGAAVVAFMWKAPADGYAKAEKVMAEITETEK